MVWSLIPYCKETRFMLMHAELRPLVLQVLKRCKLYDFSCSYAAAVAVQEANICML